MTSPKRKITILAIPGSLRANSSNYAVIRAAEKMAGDNASFTIYDGLGTLPHFDDSRNPAQPVTDMRNLLKNADGILICTPEYAFGVPGVLKNAIDWTVYSGEFVNKPTAVITAATGGDKAHHSLLLTLSALSAKIPDGGSLLISFIRSKLNEQGEVIYKDTLTQIKAVMTALVDTAGGTIE